MPEPTLTGSYVNFGNMEDLMVTAPQAIADRSKLADTSMVSVLAYVAADKMSGVLQVVPEARETHLLGFKKGQLVTAQVGARPLLERVFRRLVREGTITEEDLRKARGPAEDTAPSVLQSLFELGVCTPRDLVNAIKGTKEDVLSSLLQQGRGHFELCPNTPIPKVTDPLFIDMDLFLVKYLRGLTRHLYAGDMEPFLAPYVGRYPVKSARLTATIEGVAFNDKERKTLDEVVDGTVTLREVFTLSLLTRGATARLFVIGTFLGFVEYSVKGATRGGAEAALEELYEALKKLQDDDYFTRLGIHWTTHPSRIVPAWRKLVERYGPNASERKLSQEANQVMDQIVKLLDEAKETLADKEARRQYRRRLLGDAKLAFGATFLYKQAHMAKFRGDTRKARELVEAALDLKPTQEYLDFLRTVKSEE